MNKIQASLGSHTPLKMTEQKKNTEKKTKSNADACLFCL